jgi:hypothetical protein
MKSSGKILTIFLVIIAILLISLTAISLFFFQIEIDKGKDSAATLDTNKKQISSLSEELKKKEKEIFLLKEKHKESDDRVDDLSDELELERGLRQEIKLENQTLAKQLEDEEKEKERLREKVASNLINSQEKIASLEAKLQKELKNRNQIEQKFQELKNQHQKIGQGMPSDLIEDQLMIVEDDGSIINVEIDSMMSNLDEELLQIVEIPKNLPEGRVLTVDNDTEFVIVSLGEKEGLKSGMILGVYRGSDYLGDVQITRVQTDMSAADIIPPLSSLMIRKNDQVSAKK